MPDVRQRHSSSRGDSQIRRVSGAPKRPENSTPPFHRPSLSNAFVVPSVFATASPVLRPRPTVHQFSARFGSFLGFSCGLRSSHRAGTARSSRPVHARSSRRPFPRPTPSLPSSHSVLISPVPPVLHGGSAAPPASPPRGPVSDLCGPLLRHPARRHHAQPRLFLASHAGSRQSIPGPPWLPAGPSWAPPHTRPFSVA